MDYKNRSRLKPTLPVGFLCMSSNQPQTQSVWQFSGFVCPNTTAVPDQLFDELMPHLNGAELKVLLYIVRRTFGFKKNSDDISLSQMVYGIRKKNGEVLDGGTGLGKASVARALNSLAQKKIIVRRRRRSDTKGDQATGYTLNINNSPPVSQNETPPVSKRDTPVSHQRDTQQTVLQQTVRQQQQNNTANVTSSYHDREIAAALVDRGIDHWVVQELIHRHDRERLINNIDLFEHVLKNSPQTVSKNPAGWLRRAIEQDYATTGKHHGFQTRRQKAARATAQKQRLATQQKRVDTREREQRALLQQQDLARRKRLETLREQYHSTAQEQKIWTDVLKTLRAKISTTSFNLYLSQSHLLLIQGEQAVVAVPNAFIQNRIEAQWAGEIAQMLAEKGKQQKMTMQFITLEEAGGG